MEATEIRKLARLEDKHWWYRERRNLLAAAIKDLTPGLAVDVGAAGGGNTRVLVEHGWRAVPVEYGAEGAEVAAERGLPVLRADARFLPVADEAAVGGVFRALKPGGTFLVAVPADPALWSEHDVAVDHVRRYTRQTLLGVLQRGGFEIESCESWMVLLRPVAAWRRKKSSGSDLDDLNPLVNKALYGIVALERHLPVGKLPGVSLLVRARKPLAQ